MDKAEQEKVVRFINDEVMSNAIRKAFTKAFMKDKSQDVHHLAASRLALSYLEEAYKDLERHRSPERQTEEVENVGL